MSAITDFFKGTFVTPAGDIARRLQSVEAFVYDWDGVFNAGFKDENASSPFSEVDSMGTNMLRFGHFLLTGRVPVTAVISGEQNRAATMLSKREHFNSVYYKTRSKTQSFGHLCAAHELHPKSVCFMFDDVLDFVVAKEAGVRIMVGRPASRTLTDFGIRNGWVDYVTEAGGGQHAVREAAELILTLRGHYDHAMQGRMQYTGPYSDYLTARNSTETKFYTADASQHISEQPL